MEGKDYKPQHQNSGSGRVWAGLIILTVGMILLAGQLNLSYLFPGWIFGWPTILVIVGLVIGANSNFRSPASYTLIALGILFMLQREFHFNVWRLVFPVAIIGVGLWLLLDKRRQAGGSNGFRQASDGQAGSGAFEKDYGQWDAGTGYDGTGYSGASASSSNHTDDEYLSSTALFSEEKKIVTSKNLKGGEITNIFGGADINLMQADIQEPVTINVFQLFAGTKIIVPAHWRVQSKVVSLFAEVDDRRFVHNIPGDDQKTIYLKGTSIFGGITIKSV